MLEVTHVGSFYSFLPIMCWAGPEQAGVLFSCSGAEWTRGGSQHGRPGLAWSEAGVPGSPGRARAGPRASVHAPSARPGPAREAVGSVGRQPPWEGRRSPLRLKCCWLGTAWEP